jgi:hypothetical protein
MVPVGEHRAAAAHHTVELLCGGYGEALHRAREAVAVEGLDQHVDVIVLDGKVGDPSLESADDLQERTAEA